MGCGASDVKKNQKYNQSQTKLTQNKLKSLDINPTFKAENKNYPTYFIGLGKNKTRTILAFDEERMALVEKEIPSQMPIALWSALLQINQDTVFVAGGRYEASNNTSSISVISDFYVYQPMSNLVRPLSKMIKGRSSFPLVYHNHLLYALGGRNDKPEPN